MSEQLTQAEIDALRDAVRSGETSGIANIRSEEAQREIKVINYDFRKPKLLSAERMVKLQLVHQLLLKNLQTMFFSMFKIAGESKLSALEQVSYGEYMLSLAPPTYLLSVQANPDVGPMGIELSPPMGQILLDMLLGGDGLGPASLPPHEFSAFEMEIMRTLSDRLLEELEGAWKQLHDDLSMEIVAQGVSPEQVQIAPPDTPCLIAMIDLKLNEASTRMQFCYPFSTLQIIFERAEAGREDQTGKRSSIRQKMLRALEQTPLPANVELGRAQMTAGELSSLCIGDVIILDQPSGEPLRLNIGDRMIGSAYVGSQRGRLVAGVNEIVHLKKTDGAAKPSAPAASAAPNPPGPPTRPPPPVRPPQRPLPTRPPDKSPPDKTKGAPS